MIHNHITIYACLLLSIIGGIVFGLFHYEYLLWQRTPEKLYSTSTILPTQQQASIIYHKDSVWVKENVVININELQDACFTLMQEWLKVLQSEHMIPHYVTLDSTLIDVNKKNIYISFHKSFFYTHHATYQKLLLLVSLSKTIASLQSSLQQYILLVNDAPLIDPLIDCQESFDINYFATLY
ncbi:hypothetical protein EKK58_03520 [Candidatus Dependentiae bacterium]|nr:MAG: hypothetical protein EKK58_03520 [Candidatus Dependentiae bacterium]